MARDERPAPVDAVSRRGERVEPRDATPEASGDVRGDGVSRRPVERPTGPEGGDRFRRAGRLEQFVRSIAERVEHGWLYQTFRLPGTNRVIHDRRTGGGQPVAEATERPLSEFEQSLMQRFEQGAAQARPAADGKSHFLRKTAAQWKEFFLQFLHRAERRQVPFEAVGDAVTFRGLLKKVTDPAIGVLIGDLPLTDGRLEKFARIEVPLQAVASEMAGLPPGTMVAKHLVQDGVGGEILPYIAIGAPAEAAIATAPRERPGLFTSLKTEAEIARQLGLAGAETVGLASQTAGEEGRVHRRGKGFGRWFGGEEELSANQPGRFVPWWQWSREERYGQRRWFTAVTLVTLLTLLALGTWALLRTLQ
ncbi:MAG: hypothetical protein HYV03_05905 [Deltaproteobacteria bacterium]|nr:hypothetical protein [Deltaproteobacteria bacterium]